MLKEYIEYLKDNPEGYWFKRKLYGWGWTPAKWQGWLLILIFIALLFLNLNRLNLMGSAASEANAGAFSIETIVMVVILLLICWKTGESPRWQWGRPKK